MISPGGDNPGVDQEAFLPWATSAGLSDDQARRISPDLTIEVIHQLPWLTALAGLCGSCLAHAP